MKSGMKITCLKIEHKGKILVQVWKITSIFITYDAEEEYINFTETFVDAG